MANLEELNQWFREEFEKMSPEMKNKIRGEENSRTPEEEEALRKEAKEIGRNIDIRNYLRKNNIYFDKYRYFYDSGIVRMNKETKEYERLYQGIFKPIHPERDYDDRLKDGFDALSELNEWSSKDLELLINEMRVNVG